MKILSAPQLSPSQDCPYLDKKDSAQEYFFALEISDQEMDILINSGWRKFGAYVFRPSCLTCKMCRPTRVKVNEFIPNKKQRKLLRDSLNLEVKYHDLEFKIEHYEIFKSHSKERFNQTMKEIGDVESFKETFFFKTNNSLICEYYLEDKMIAWGIIDVAKNSLSSVYFAFNPEYSKYSLGKLSILKEIEYAKEKQIEFYHLGYSVEGNKSMAYKTSYYPHQLMNWEGGKWEDQVKK